MFEVSLESEFINNLSQESRSWLAKAIGVVILGKPNWAFVEPVSVIIAFAFK